jgi:hypothetical protein
MSTPVTVSLPIDDRRTSRDFYRAFLGLEAPGEPADDGVPEPLEFHITEGLHLVLVPTGGFGWVLGPDVEVAGRGTVSALVSLPATSDSEVDAVTRRAEEAGGSVLKGARREEWGYCSLVADPDGHVWQVVAPA